MSNDKKKDSKENDSSPIVNVEWTPPTWTDQFQKFIIDLGGVINEKNDKN
jgi:hypothetical protein|tara:strand:- start:11989 stop:12138 length:150 start_codon:yes stop_codon:yes gene_type:complete